MATFYLIRHGKPDYSRVESSGLFGFGRDFAPLTAAGERAAQQVAQDPRLQQAEFIVASPFTRALQTAHIIAQTTGLPIKIEVNLREWAVDTTNSYRFSGEAFEGANEFLQSQGKHTRPDQAWETIDSLNYRVHRVADQYADYDKVILVAHEFALKTIAPIPKMNYCELVECEYVKGQPPAQFFF